MKKGILLLISCLIFGLNARADESVTGVTITSQDTLKKIVGDTDVTLTWTVNPSNATNNNVSWSSTVETVATVTNAGVVSFLGVGETKIIVKTEDGNFKDTCIVQVTAAISVTGVTITSQDTLKKNTGDTDVTLTWTVNPGNATNNNVSWLSTVETVATVTNAGVVSFLGAGETKIIVKTEDGDFKDTCIVQVTAIPVTGVTITSQDTLKKNAGDTDVTLTWAVNPGNATNNNVSWSSTVETVATVTNAGVVSFLGAGETKIIVKTADGDFKDTCIVQVTAIPVTGVTITSQDTLKKNAGDTDVTLTWTVNPGNATNNNVSWSSTVETVATVTNAGVVSFLGAGETKIIVKTEDGDFKDTCIVQVKPVLATKIEFVKDTVYVQLGDSVALKVNVTPNNTTDKGANWKSLTPTIATVSDTGLVIAKSVGKVSIVAISKSVSTLTDTCIVYVTESQIPVKSVTLDNDSVNLIKDDTFQLIAEVAPANASNKKVNWTSKAPAIASVSSNGLVTAKETGKTLIYAITDDGGFKDSCIVVVRERVIFTNPEDATSRSGKFPISLNVPDDEILTGSFIVKFPIGFELDKTNTKLAGTFETASYLSIKDGESNSWVIEIKDKADLKNMLRATTSKMKVLDIAYTINQSVINGTYNINITDAIFKFSDNSEIKEEKMTVKLKVNIDPNSNDLIESGKVYAYSTNNRLYVQSEEAETISVYSFNGTLLYSKEKPVGEIILDVNIQEPIVIVKGSSGWSQKVTK